MRRHPIILVEDDANVSLMLSRQLERAGYEVRAAATIATARRLLQTPWDLILLDRNLPDGDGIELCREIRAADPHAYIVMLTANSSDAAKLEGFAYGADDYIAKPAHLEELVARIRVGLRIVGLQKQLVELSHTDALTSLRNRRAFDERLQDAFDQSRRYARPLSLAIVDVDRFKAINDTGGHDRGDLVLCGIAEIITSGIRKSDFAARIGGEEFAILLPETGLFDALQFGEKVRSSVAAMPVRGHAVTVSIGIANVPHSLIDDQAAFFRAADQALLRAKINGRNRVEIERRRTCRVRDARRTVQCAGEALG